MKVIPEEDYRQLSELQHFAFCRRQWALIHIEQQWEENYKTVDGSIMHERVHDASKSESRGDVLTIRGMRVHSHRLCVTGVCDVVEFHRDEIHGIAIHGKKGLWRPIPVEYKRGKPKEDDSDRLQLCGQAMCLEEMLCCEIPEGILYYGEPHRRQQIDLTAELRKTVTQYLTEMNDYYQRGYTPLVKTKRGCQSCSLKDICLPSLNKKKSVKDYLDQHLGEMN